MANDDVFLKEQTNYIIVSRRNNIIHDVWKVEDSVVEFMGNAKGWRIITNKNAVFFIQSEVEIWHIPDKESELWNMYHKYHADQEKATYRELYVDYVAPAPPPPPPKKKKFFRWPYKIEWNW